LPCSTCGGISQKNLFVPGVPAYSSFSYIAFLLSKNWKSMKKTPKRFPLAALLLLPALFFCLQLPLLAQVPKPEDIFGFRPGADYKMADYGQMLSFYEKLDAASERVQMIEIGKSTHGRPIKLLFGSGSPHLGPGGQSHGLV
jgi:hypothetical protein